MLVKIGQSVLVGLGVGLLCLLLSVLLGSLNVPPLDAVAGFLGQWAWAIGVFFGAWYFFFGIPGRATP